MDEQYDQAVLDIEDAETDTDSDYLAILREMQQSLDAAVEPHALLRKTDEFAHDVANPTFEMEMPPSAENSASAGNFGADYFGDAETQPLPKISTDADVDPTRDDADIVNQMADETSFDEATTAPVAAFSVPENAVPSVFEPPTSNGNGIAVEFHDHSFSDFDELSPILFGLNEQIEVAEPVFEEDLSAPAMTREVTEAEMTMESDVQANVPDNLAESRIAQSPATSEEMPVNLSFGEMFAEDSPQPIFVEDTAPQSEINQATEAEFTVLLDQLENEHPIVNNPNELSALDSEQNLAEQDLAELSSPEQIGKAVETFDDDSDFGLPEAMLLNENVDNFAPEPTFSMFDEESELEQAEETVSAPFLLQETQIEDLAAMPLAVPSFLQAELSGKEPTATDENNFEPSKHLLTAETTNEQWFESESTTEETALATNTDALAPPFIESHQVEVSEVDSPPLAAAPPRNDYFDFTGLDNVSDADAPPEMPQTALFESLASETETLDYPVEFSSDYLPPAVQNDFSNSVEMAAETSDTVLFDHKLEDNSAENRTPEADSVEFDLPAEPLATVETDSPSVVAELSLKSVFNESKQDSAARSLLQEISEIPKSVSFLKERFVIFKLDDTLYAFPAVNVAEIGQLLPITPLPFVPSWFLGISNLRGDILSVVGLRELWEKNAATPHKAKILVVHSEKQALTIGLVVDAVREMRHVTPEEIFSDDSTVESHFAPYQIGMVEYEGQNLCLLNAEKLLETLRS